MKKRLFTLALAVALLVTFIPAQALTVRAESNWTPSQDMIDVLKRWEGFSSKPYWDNTQWTVGYGTRVPEGKLEEYMEHGITEEEAEALLQQFFVEMGGEINVFADKYGLTFNQGQFDALLSLSFNCGTGWLYKPSTLRTAVIDGWTGDDLLFAFGQWSNSGGRTVLGLVRRRLAEAQMYLDGVYDVAPKDDYSYVLFNANGGDSNISVQGYDVNAAPEIRALATYDDLIFAGWYTDPTGGEKVTKLDATVKGYTLYAHWTAGNGEGTPGEEGSDEEIVGTPVDYYRQVVSGNLHVFEQPVKGALVIDTYVNGDVIQIVAEYTDSNGVKWGEVKESGWVNLSYTTAFDPGEDTDGPGVKVTVTGTDVNVRRGPGTSYAVVGKANLGEELLITRTANGSGYLWGKFEMGWIALKYTNYDQVISGDEPEDPKPEDPKPEDPKPEDPKPIATGTVKLQSEVLNVRKGPGTNYAVVATLTNGTRVEIFEFQQVGATQWGRINLGWISMTYVVLDESEDPDPEDPDPEDPKPEDPDPEDPKPEDPKPEDPKPEDPKPEDPKPEDPDPEDPDPEDPKPEDPKPEAPAAGKVVITSGTLNIRSGPGTEHSVVGSLKAGEKVIITQQRTVSGVQWGKMDKGWVCMTYIALDSQAEEPEKTMTGKVSAGGSRLRVRTGPGTTFGICAYLDDGSAVEILELKIIDGTKWGRVEQGWVDMRFIELDEPTTEPGQPETYAGVVTATCLHIRQNAGTRHTIVGRLYKGEKIIILEIKEVNGIQWGRISSGWVCLDYVKMI